MTNPDIADTPDDTLANLNAIVLRISENLEKGDVDGRTLKEIEAAAIIAETMEGLAKCYRVIIDRLKVEAAKAV